MRMNSFCQMKKVGFDIARKLSLMTMKTKIRYLSSFLLTCALPFDTHAFTASANRAALGDLSFLSIGNSQRKGVKQKEMPLTSQDAIAHIVEIAESNRACLSTFVRGRGRVNKMGGVFPGLAVSLARSVCRGDDDPAKKALIYGAKGSMDALNHYGLGSGSERAAKS